MKLFLSPHNDDAILFGCFTLLREQPTVLTVFDSLIQYARGFPACGLLNRRNEDEAAIKLTGCKVRFGAVSDMIDGDRIAGFVRLALAREPDPERVWAPAVEDGGHEQHNIVGKIAAELWPGRVTHYMTYRRGHGRSLGREVLPEKPEHVGIKLRALACYGSQMDPRLGCVPWFLDGQREYVQE